MVSTVGASPSSTDIAESVIDLSCLSIFSIVGVQEISSIDSRTALISLDQTLYSVEL